MRISALAYFRRKRKARSNENRCSLILSGIENVLFSFDFLFSRNAFARLIAYRAACFASGLASASAFSAAGNLFFGGLRNRLDHNCISRSFFDIIQRNI
jgi:hypothetical protein